MDDQNIDLAELSKKLKDAYPQIPVVPGNQVDLQALSQKMSQANVPSSPVEDNTDQEQAPSQEDMPAAPKLPTFKTPSTSDVYGAGLSDADIVAAQQSRNKGQLFANLGRAAETITQGLTKGAHVADDKYYEDLAKQASQPITDIGTKRSAKDEELKRHETLTQQAMEKELQDPNSDTSKFVKDMYAQSFPEIASSPSFSGASAYTLAKAGGLDIAKLKSAMEARKLSLQQSAQFKQALLDQKEKFEGEREGRMATTKVEGDKNVQDFTRSISRLDKASDILNSPIPINSQALADVESDISSAMRLGGANALGYLQRTEMDTLNRDLSKLRQYATSNIEDLRKVDPNLVKQTQAILEKVKDGFNKDLVKRKQNLAESYSKAYATNPHVTQVLNQYKKETGEAAKQGFTPAQEAGISAFMQAHPELDKDKAIEVLKKAGRL